MIGSKLRSEQGVGLIQAVAAAFIVALAISGLFVASYVSQHKAIGVYHYKSALLKGLQKFEEIKFHNRLNNGSVMLNNISTGEFVIDDKKDVTVKGLIHPFMVTTYVDAAVSQYVRYDEVRMKITWYDGPRYFHNKVLNPQRQIILREDYFYRSDSMVTP